ncbi:histidine kinase dimerization/phosphoacceptor domain -containing protein [Hymenobacter negativus]|uniref:histidine kinase n=1 Tax=Hymenobacter negativus TaxID=2795026 RepID=A0ABS3QLJ6_9BACT|nr:histidine kinase dimerization/phosphoacceptor domain -containing protein [Hymenobacter negativus]MBO2012121.1 hypothetical protein [Hymenobacter negativus]
MQQLKPLLLLRDRDALPASSQPPQLSGATSFLVWLRHLVSNASRGRFAKGSSLVERLYIQCCTCRAVVVGLLLLASWPLQAEPRLPFLRPATVDSMKKQLKQTPPGQQRFRMLLRLSQDLIDKYQFRAPPLDSAETYRRQAESYCWEAERLSHRLGDTRALIESKYALGNMFVAIDQPSVGKKWITQGLTSSARQHDVHLEADGWYYLSDVYTYSDTDIAQRIACLQHAKALYKTLGDAANAAYVLKTIADLHMQKGQVGLAREELQQALTLYRSIGYRRLYYTYDLLGTVSSRLGEFREAIRYGQATIESARANQDTTDLSLFYVRVGLIYNTLKQYPDALAYYNLAERHAEQVRDSSSIIYVTSLTTATLIAQNRPQQALRLALEKLRRYAHCTCSNRAVFTILYGCYLANRQFTEAEKVCLQEINRLESLKPSDYKTTMEETYFAICRLYLTTRQYSKARLYAEKAWALQSAVGPPWRAAMQRLLFRLDSAQGNYLAAIGHQQRYLALHDSIFDEKKSQQIASLQIQYETQKKEQDLALLTKQNLVQQANLRRRESQRNASVAIGVMLVLLLSLGYNRYRLKQRSNQQLEARQAEIDRKNAALQTLVREKESLLKEIHHRVKNNLQVVMSLLNSQASYLANDTALAAIQESQHRVQAMALIHHKLYQSEQVARIAMPAYLNELVAYLRDAYNLPQLIGFELAVQPVELDVTQAVPLGLIVNEAVTNILKYAFPQGRPGRVQVILRRLTGNDYELEISDNGVGLSPNYAPERSCSLGMTLIHGFSKQLGGTLTIRNDEGLKITLTFSEQPSIPVSPSLDYAY